jgi:arylsulfatase A-like enzyme
MSAIFYATGPGLKRGHELAPIRHIDVAPTLARLLGIPAPAQSCGQVLEDALAAP